MSTHNSSDPSPPLPPAPVKAIDWAKLIALVSILLTQLGVLFVPDVPAPQPAPVVVVDPVTPPALVAVPESWIVLDATNTRVVDPAIEKVAGSLKPGRWTAQGIPKPGERGVTLSIVVSDGTTPPVPEPPKPEPPKPTPAPTLTGFAKVAYDASRSLPAIDRANVADNFEGTAARIAAGELRTVQDANASLKAENAADVDRTTWLPFFVAWATEADSQNKSGKLRTVDEYAQAFRDTAEGLRK